jgi:MATE family multidrug resistance protein
MKTLSLRALELIRLSLPLAAMEIPVVATVAIDTVALGRLDARAVAAGGLGAAVFLLVSSICVSVVTSIGHEAAYRKGRNDRRGLRGTLYGGAAISSLLGCVAAGITLALAPFLHSLGQDRAIAQNAAFYLYAVAPGLPFLLLAVCFRGMVALQPRAIRLVGVAASSVAVKVLFIVVAWEWMSSQSPGSALLVCGATSSITFLAMSASAWLAFRRSRLLNPSAASPEQTVQGAYRVLRRGVTIGLTTAVQSGFFTVVAILCGHCSPADLAAHQIANQCTLLPLMLAFGMSQAAATLTSRAIGASSAVDAKRASWDAVLFSVAAMTVVALALAFCGRAAIDAILPQGTPDRDHVARIAWQLVMIGACCLLADGAQNVAMGALRGMGHGRLTIHNAVIGYWLVGIPLAWWLGQACGLGATGVWIGVGVGLHASAVLLLCFLYRVTRAAPGTARDPAAS